MRRSHTSAIVVLVLLAIVIISITTSCQARQSPRTIDDLARTPRTPARHDSSSSSQPQPQPRASRQLDPVIGTLDTDRELALVLVIHRHGDRAPVVYWPEDEPLWEGLGQITPLGMNQLYQLGSLLRTKYIINERFLEDYYRHDHIYCRAVDTDRTLISSEGLLLGLFPQRGPRLDDGHEALPCSYQPVPVHTVPLSEEYLLRGWFTCPQYLEFLYNDLMVSSEWLAKELETQSMRQELSSYFHNEPVTLQNLWEYVDTLYCYYAHNRSDPRAVPRELYERAKLVNDWVNQQMFVPRVGKYIAGYLLWNLVQDLETAVAGAPSPRLKLYSGHDVTLASLMSAFGVGIQTLPGYASNIVIELRRERALQADVLPQYFVTVVYNDTESVRVVHVPGCPTDQESCEFTMFAAGVRPSFQEDHVAGCAVTTLQPPPREATEPETPATPPTEPQATIECSVSTFRVLKFLYTGATAVVLGEFLVAVVVAAVWLIVRRCKQRRSIEFVSLERGERDGGNGSEMAEPDGNEDGNGSST